MWAALLVLVALAQGPASVTTPVFEVSGKVDRVNRSARTVTVLPAGAPGVASAPIYVGPDLAIFDSVKAGDFVVVRYYDSYIVELTPGTRIGHPNTLACAELGWPQIG